MHDRNIAGAPSRSCAEACRVDEATLPIRRIPAPREPEDASPGTLGAIWRSRVFSVALLASALALALETVGRSAVVGARETAPDPACTAPAPAVEPRPRLRRGHRRV
jgi:hypothetical protein